MRRFLLVLVSMMFLNWTLLRADVVSVGSANVLEGSTFVIPVNIAGASDLFGFQFDVAYDPTILQLLSIDEGAFLQTGGTTFFIPGTINNVAGTATSTADSLLGPGPGAAGSGTLVTLDFRAVAAGVSALSLSNISLLDSNLNDIDFTSSDGSVTVSAGAVPEPISTTFFIIGLLGVMAFRFRTTLRTKAR